MTSVHDYHINAPQGFVEVGLVPLAQELREVEESNLDMKWGQMVVRCTENSNINAENRANCMV